MPRSTLVAGFLCVSALAIAPPPACAQQQPSAARLPTVAVMDFRVSSLRRDADYSDLGKGIARILNTELRFNPAIQVVERTNLRRLLEEQALDSTTRVDPATAARIGRVLGVHHMVFGGFLIDLKGRMRLDAWAVNVETSEIEYVVTKTRHIDEVLELVAEVATEMNRGMRLPPMPVRTRPASRDAVPGETKRRATMLLSNAEAQRDRGNRPQAIDLCRAALALYPDFEAAQKSLAELEAKG